ncbi:MULTISPECIES: RNA polymerase sigma factor [Bacillota]|jgi:RNA polymerase sigma factor (sigma-70 family)|uniref:RNA polymerase sigma factor n=4 Tax=Erysipelotrichaceae TaxID=128827 RepID=A0A7G9GS92_9FIRM|nr:MULTISPECIES: RNA polymerase sigma factor [Bacillota]QNM13674.1 RNA polymerase sigma factor [[Eubacterium] hominis]MCH4283646.1 RNA polymerase sigma factor [Amedibacillus hominis]RGB54180.1 RNA polymerase sigma factor [Absiella sp. AM10-20]RGB56623.1 RNA polymerase sigma factor [Absiella sp. AM22-9]RGB64749.1 RNA polymerase sigma factor [Absiella sp. AM09-45]
MNKIEQNKYVEAALEGDSQALETLLIEVKNFIFNLSLRMLGNVHDAQDATQDILIRIMTRLDSFHQESAFTTWVYRLSVNYLINYKKSIFAQHSLSFEFYEQDTKNGFMEKNEALLQGIDEDELAWELRMSCTNVMLQCFDPQTRCIFILGTMFHLDSKIAGELLDMSPDNYRQKLSRAKKKMTKFLGENCGLTKTGYCDCKKRVSYAIASHRLHPNHLEFNTLQPLNEQLLTDVTNHMVEIDKQVPVFEDLPNYEPPISVEAFMKNLLESDDMKVIQSYDKDEVIS